MTSQQEKGAVGGLPTKIETFPPHQLRHTYASLLYKAGIDVLTAKEQLGHNNVSATLSIYTHIDSGFKTKNISKLNDYLSPEVNSHNGSETIF